MTDLFVFGIGVLVTLIVGAAVGLLLWGASQEPRSGLQHLEVEPPPPDDSGRVEPAPLGATATSR